MEGEEEEEKEKKGVFRISKRNKFLFLFRKRRRRRSGGGVKKERMGPQEWVASLRCVECVLFVFVGGWFLFGGWMFCWKGVFDK